MPFNTAVFYDIENLLKGYSFSQQVANNLSLKEIVKEVRATDLIGGIALQRAYANWSDPRLATMRSEINELGIDPMQVFGFAFDQKKNAADIQLAIDAVDLAHVRPQIEVFVIVSGDGGFAALAKKLHEYGKMVIGVAYRYASNRTFQAVCDKFVFIRDPEGQVDEEKSGRPVAEHPVVTDPRNVRVLARLGKATNPEDAVGKARELFICYMADPQCRTDLAKDGISLSTVGEAVRYLVPGFKKELLGFTKLSHFLQHACTGTKLCIAKPPDAQDVLIYRAKLRAGMEVKPDIDAPDRHTPDCYRELLAHKSPRFPLPAPAELLAVVGWLSAHPPERADADTIGGWAATDLNGNVSEDGIKDALQSLIAAEAFELHAPEGGLGDPMYTLKADVRAADKLMAQLRDAVRKKLTENFTPKEAVLAEFFTVPVPVSPPPVPEPQAVPEPPVLLQHVPPTPEPPAPEPPAQPEPASHTEANVETGGAA